VHVPLGFYVGYDSTQNAALVALLGKDDHAYLGEFRVGGCVEAEIERPCTEILQRADSLQVTNYADVLKTPATVLPVANIGGIGWVDESGVEFAA
jgi:hypothetical protein